VRLTGRDPDTAAALNQMSARHVINSRYQDSDYADWTQGPQNEMICVPSPAHPTHLQAARSRRSGAIRPHRKVLSAVTFRDWPSASVRVPSRLIALVPVG